MVLRQGHVPGLRQPAEIIGKKSAGEATPPPCCGEQTINHQMQIIMSKSVIYCLFLLFLLPACEPAELDITAQVLENDFVEVSLNDELVRYNGFRFGQDQSYYRPADPLSRTPSELRFGRTTADGLEEIVISIKGIELGDWPEKPKTISFSSESTPDADTDSGFQIELRSRELSAHSHCPTLTAHNYEVNGTLFVDAWSVETGILEGRFEAELVQPVYVPGISTGIFPEGIRVLAEERRLFSEGAFRVWIQQL